MSLRILRGVEVFQRILRTRKKRKAGIEREYEGIVDLLPCHRRILRRILQDGGGQRHPLFKREEDQGNDDRGLCLVEQKVWRVDMEDTVQKNGFVDLNLLKTLLNEGRHLLFDEEDHHLLYQYHDGGHHPP